MKWFGYVWIAILIIGVFMKWLIWTIKCIKDFITDFRSKRGLSFSLEKESSWLLWILVHIGMIFILSLIWFIIYPM